MIHTMPISRSIFLFCVLARLLAQSQRAAAYASPVSSNIVYSVGKMQRIDREILSGHKGLTVWMTGLSGAGKSAIAEEVERILIKQQGMRAYRLDGDNLRFGLNSDLGFSDADRKENVRRTAEVSLLLADAGTVAICSLISPFTVDRDRARQAHEAANVTFLEVFVDAPLAVAEDRDPKGLYKKARAGKIKQFTGIDAPYEAPTKPDVHLRTHEQSVEKSAEELADAIWYATRLSLKDTGWNSTKIVETIEEYQSRAKKKYEMEYEKREDKAQEGDAKRIADREARMAQANARETERKEKRAVEKAAKLKATGETTSATEL